MTNIEHLVDNMKDFSEMVDLLEKSEDDMKIEIASYYLAQVEFKNNSGPDNPSYYDLHFYMILKDLWDYQQNVKLNTFLTNKSSEIMSIAYEFNVQRNQRKKEGTLSMGTQRQQTVEVPKPLHVDLSKIAESKHMTTTRLVRKALAEYVNKNR